MTSITTESYVGVYGRSEYFYTSTNNPFYIDAADGNDIVYIANSQTGTVYGGVGRDLIIDQSTGNNTIYGDLTSNSNSGFDPDVILGGDGNNFIFGGGGNNYVNGGRGDDFIKGGSNDELLEGGANNDTIQGGTGADFLYGGSATSSAQAQFLSTNFGTITTDYNGTNDTSYSLTLDPYDYTVTNLYNTGADDLSGGTGNDVLDGGDGADVMDGGAGDDRIFVDNPNDVVIEAAGGGSDYVFSSVSYVLKAGVEIERLQTIDSSATTAINLTGNEYSNTIIGNAGANLLDGKLGNDLLIGGAGKDTFFFSTKPSTANFDHIKDFAVVDDTIRLENSGSSLYAAFKYTGVLHSDEFKLITSAKQTVDTNDHILYDRAHGALYYDPNGGSISGRVEFAVLDNHAALTYKDFLIV